MAVRRVAVLAFPSIQAIDVFGPIEVFSAADRLAGGGEYAVELLAADTEPIETSSGIGVVPTRPVSGIRGPLDTLIVAGGDGVDAALREDRLARWVARVAPRTRRVCSVCTGAFLLAEAGLLDGRRATTTGLPAKSWRGVTRRFECSPNRSSFATARSPPRPA